MASPKSLSGGADALRLGRLSTQGYGRLTSKSPSSTASTFFGGADATRLPDIAPPPMAWTSDGDSKNTTQQSWRGGQPRAQKPNERVRALICNWPAHFCKESLLRVMRDPLEASLPLQHPYVLSVRCDLRRRKVELQNEKQNAYLVAFDTDKLRTLGSGNGIDAMNASTSFLARDCVCSDMIPLRGLYGEVQIELRPPDTAEGDVLVILRIVKSGNLKSMQDWYPIGDPVVVRVEPRECREDRAYIKREIKSLNMESDESKARADNALKALGASQKKCVASLSDVAEMRGAVARWQLEVNHSREDAEQLHGEVSAARKDMEAKHGEVATGKTSVALVASLQASRQRQAATSAQAAATMERSLQASESEMEALEAIEAQIFQQHQEAAAHARADSQAKTTIEIREAMDKKIMAQLRASEQAAKELQIALDKSRGEVQEHQEFANTSRATLERAQTEAAEERDKLAEARSQLASRGSNDDGVKKLAEAAADGSLAKKLDAGVATVAP